MRVHQRQTCAFMLIMVLTLAAGAAAENLLPNGSFEVGIGTWIGFDSGQRGGQRDPEKYGEMTLVKEGLISTTQAKIGRQSFCFSYPGFIRSKEIKLDPARKYTISLYARSREGRGDFGCSISSSYRSGTGHGDRLSSAGLRVKAGTEWERHHLTVALPESRNGYYKIWISHGEGDVVWLDGVQIEAGETLTDYGPATRAEVGISSGREAQSNLFYAPERVPVLTRVRVHDPGAGAATVRFGLWDYRDVKVKEFERTVKLDAGGYGKDRFILTPEWLGLMSLIATVTANGEELGKEELQFGYVRPPRPASERDDQISPVGTHVSGRLDILVAERLGIRWQRYHDFFDRDGSVRWIDVEPEEGKWHFQDGSMNRYREHGFNLVGTLWTAPKWALTHPEDVASGWARHLPDLDRWREYVFRTVSHYKDRIHYWEVWNEPFSYSWWSDTPENYFLLMKTASEAAREADPQCRILGGCLAPLDYAGTRSFMNRLFAAGGLQYMDILSIHADQGGMGPSDPAMPEESMGLSAGATVTQAFGEITALMRAYGDVKPIWNTERPIWCMPYSRLYPWVDDVPWTRSDPPQNPVHGAQFVVRSVVAEMANNCPKTFFYPFSGGRYEDGDLTSSIMSGHMKLKSSGVVMSELLLQLGRATLHTKVDWGNVARCYLFDSPDGPVAVAWGLRAREKPGTLELPRQANSFAYLDIMGNPRSDIDTGTVCTVPLGAEPVYIRGQDIDTLARVLPAGRVTGLMPKRAGDALSRDAGLLGPVTYAAEATLAKGLRVYAFEREAGSGAIIVSKRSDYPVIVLAASDGLVFREAGHEMDVSEKEGNRRTAEIMSIPIVVASEQLAAAVLLDRIKHAELRGLAEFELEGVWITTVEGRLQLTMALANVSLSTITPVVVIKSLPAGIAAAAGTVTLAPLAAGKSILFDVPLTHADAPSECRGQVVIEATGGGAPVTFKRPLALAYASRVDAAVAIDGDLSEWSENGVSLLNEKEQVKIGQSAWQGRADLSARVRHRWDDRFLYIAVEVTDDFIERRREAMQAWNGTSVEVFLDTNHRDDLGKAFYDKDDFQFLYGPATPRSPTDVRAIAPYSGQAHLPGLDMKSKRTEAGYTMEIAIPRVTFETEFLPGVLKPQYGPGMSMGISVVANDRAEEKEGRKSSLVWGGTMQNWRNPTKFGTLILLP